MATFKTSDGREYSTVVNLGVLRRTEAEFGKRLPELAADEVLREKWMCTDTDFATVLYQIVKPQVDEAGLTQEQWEETLTGDAMESAYMAVLYDLRDHAREPFKSIMAKWIEKTEELKRKIIDDAKAAIESMDKIDVAKIAKDLLSSKIPKTESVGEA